MTIFLSRCAAAAVVVVLVAAAPAAAQMIAPPGSRALAMPPPPAPPPPSMAVPVVPKLDELPRVQNAPQRRGSFSDRMTTCMHDAAAAGFGPRDRAIYSRACANR